jgi:hypothetical protein
MTSVPASPDCAPHLSDHLIAVQSLCQSVQAGIAALGSNRLTAFNVQVELQKELCTGLESAMNLVAISARDQTLICSSEKEEQSLHDVDQGHHQLAALNRAYAALLRRSRRSIAMQIALCDSCLGGSGTVDPGHSGRHTWRTEM